MALVNITSSLHAAKSSGWVSVLMLPDLPVEHNVANHSLLCDALSWVLDFQDITLSWFSSYLIGDFFSVLKL